ncbi:MAG: hypothetical protein HY795_11930 [Desulfovibrio sp.]|nr:hypothetical protein [Desulfovibrio sp.]MBI4958097.1 hypothetical protein [Desulfovibrio sp.]
MLFEKFIESTAGNIMYWFLTGLACHIALGLLWASNGGTELSITPEVFYGKF